ncbi:MAG: energy transducer TonB [Bacteroidales bacterium]|nr:energy transducer TonB [Bacteroidales bacterium]
MEQKKSEKANLQSKKFTFLEIGLVLTLLAIWGVFEFTTKAESASAFNQITLTVDDGLIEIPVTHPEPPQPPAPPARKIAEIIEVTDDPETICDDPIDAEIDVDGAVQIEELPVISCTDEEDDEETVCIFIAAEEMPMFKGGDKALLKYISENVVYPEIAKENDIQGTVYIGFVIDEKGKVTDVTLVRGVDPLLDKEALKVVENLPDWKPGKQSGKNVKVRMNIPIKFQLAN